MKTITNSWFILLLFLPFIFSSCEKVKGKGEVVSETRTVTGYSGISLAIDATVNFTTDTIWYLEIKAQQNILDVLETYVDGGNNLVIRYKSNVIVGKHEPIEIFVAGPDVNGFDISGSGNLFVINPLVTGYAEADISGSGNLAIYEIQANEFHQSISGSGNFQSNSGVINFEHLTISGSGNIQMEGVQADSSWVTISGSGNVTVWVEKYLDVTISGSGSVFYKGNPFVNTKISGSGSVTKI